MDTILDTKMNTIQWAKGWQYQCIKLGAPDYPILLSKISDPPKQLYVLGDARVLSEPQLAVIGSRSPTQEGVAHALSFAKRLSGARLTITSGLAIGIDGSAHRGAINASGRTIAVLGSGLDVLYPHRHLKLAKQILGYGGAIISEYQLGTQPVAHHFLARNRIISGLSLATLVVEAGERSGTLNTARHAGSQGRDVFALPGPLANPFSRGCHHLIREGAALVETPAQLVEALIESPLLEVLGRRLGTLDQGYEQIEPADLVPDSIVSKPVYQKVLAQMSQTPMGVSELVERTKLTVPAVSTILSALEMEGFVVADLAGFRLAEST